MGTFSREALIVNATLIGLTVCHFISVVWGIIVGYDAVIQGQVLQKSNPLLAGAPIVTSSILVIVTYGIGGSLHHGKAFGWAFWQPFRGGVRFIVFQFFTWILMATSVVVPFLPWIIEQGMSRMLMTDSCDPRFSATESPNSAGALIMAASAVSFVAELFTLCSLFAFEPPSQAFEWKFLTLREGRPDSSGLAVMFICMQILLAFCSMIMLYITEELHQDRMVGVVVLVGFMIVLIASVSMTVGVGGQWLHRKRGWEAWQPGKGGLTFVILQAIGWTLFGFVLAVTLIRIAEVLLPREFVFHNKRYGRMLFKINGALPKGPLSVGFFGVVAEIILATSLFVFQEDEINRARRYYLEGRKRQREAWLAAHTGLEPHVKAAVLRFL